MVQRTLTPIEPTAEKAIRFRFTCRTVRWDSEIREWKFNGRIGKSVSVKDTTIAHIFNSTTFLPLSDQRSRAAIAEHNYDAAPVTTWRFKNPDERRTIERFIEGMYETEAAKPEEIPVDIPADAQKFLTRSTLPSVGSARPRVVKGISARSQDSDYDSDEDSGDEESDTNFANLMTGTNIKTGTTADEEESGKTTDSEEGIPMFESLLGKTDRRLMPPPQSPSQNRTLSYAKIFSTPQVSKADETSIPGLTNASYSVIDETSSTPVTAIPSWSRSYAKVDKAGLVSPAVNMAAWKHETMSLRQPKKDRSGISRRQLTLSSSPATPIPADGRSATMSTSAGPELHQFQPLSTPPPIPLSPFGSTRVQPTSDIQSDMQPWARNVIQQDAYPMKLIDDTSTQCEASVKLPPGLGPPPDGNAHAAQTLQEPVAQNPITSARQSGGMPQSLIDLFNSVPMSSAPKVKLPPTTANQSLHQTSSNATTAPATTYHTPEGDDRIIERLQPSSNEPRVKRNTMRQQAGKRGNQGSSRKPNRSGEAKVELPKPDPVPPPRQASAPKIQKGSTSSKADFSKATASLKDLSIEDGSGSTVEYPGNSEKAPAKPETAVERLLQKVSDATDIAEAEVSVDFGMVLVRHPDTKEFHKGVLSKEALQTKLDKAGNALQTAFIARMTTSSTDAQYILELAKGTEITAKVEYKIQLKTAEGNLRVVRFDQEAMNDFVILSGDNDLGTLYMHYPMHVWDAQVTIIKPATDVSIRDSVADFMFSMQTTENAPSFFAAIPQSSFTVVKVYAKRIFSKKISEGVKLQVTEVRDLSLDSVNSPNHNFKATTLPDEMMVEQQCLWWECDLHSKTTDCASAGALQGISDYLVSQMDGVGFSNKGPWEKAQVKEVPETQVWTGSSNGEICW